MVTRRDFLKVGVLSLGALALRNLTGNLKPYPPSEESNRLRAMMGRITTDHVSIYSQPDFKSERTGSLERDTLLELIEGVQSEFGPVYNRRWYMVAGGYIHSGFVQRVENAHLNSSLPWIAEAGQLAEITVPYSQSFRWTQTYGWTELYRLYYQSVHWIKAIVEGPDGNPWYQLADELLHVNYCVPVEHLRPILFDELTPIAADIPSNLKKIEISLIKQTLTAFQDGEVVLHTQISSGVPDIGPREGNTTTQTPKGRFHVQLKMPSKHMGDGHLTSDLDAYELVGVPWVSFFDTTGVAIHGTFWHDNFGTRMSHGCVNMRNAEAKWLYRWSTPSTSSSDWVIKGMGTSIRVI